MNVCNHQSSIKCEKCEKILLCDNCEEEADYFNVGDESYCIDCFKKSGGRITPRGKYTFEDEDEEERETLYEEERKTLYEKYPQETRHGSRHLILKNGFSYNIEPIEKGFFDMGINKRIWATAEEIQTDIDICEKMTLEEIQEYKEQAKENHIEWLISERDELTREKLI